MLDHGHPQAGHLPIWLLSEEAEFVKKRLDTQLANEAILLQMALSTMPSMVVKPTSTKTLKRHFDDLIKKMIGG